ncbi:unnamed protein product [Dovyalis caffra]|uniref:DUF7392 domain-containing protein n=1 Tax=Dovyalis caffra TaxID=77055 RepID=A0AAV1SIR4_9ROSI|nr:unnamed protein product [Dovyalis caffra]
MAILIEHSFFDAYARDSRDDSSAAKLCTGDTISMNINYVSPEAGDIINDLSYATLALFKSQFHKMEDNSSSEESDSFKEIELESTVSLPPSGLEAQMVWFEFPNLKSMNRVLCVLATYVEGISLRGEKFDSRISGTEFCVPRQRMWKEFYSMEKNSTSSNVVLNSIDLAKLGD